MIPERRLIFVRLHCAGSNLFQIYIDGKLRYAGIRFTKREAHERIDTLRRHCDVEWEDTTLDPISQGGQNVASKKATKKKEAQASKKKQPAKQTQAPVAPDLFSQENKDKFLSLIERRDAPGQCWIWKGSFIKERGKTLAVFTPKGFSWRMANRYGYQLEHPEADLKLRVKNTCENPKCVNFQEHVVPAAFEPKPAATKSTPVKKRAAPAKSLKRRKIKDSVVSS